MHVDIINTSLWTISVLWILSVITDVLGYNWNLICNLCLVFLLLGREEEMGAIKAVLLVVLSIIPLIQGENCITREGKHHGIWSHWMHDMFTI